MLLTVEDNLALRWAVQAAGLQPGSGSGCVSTLVAERPLLENSQRLQKALCGIEKVNYTFLMYTSIYF